MKTIAKILILILLLGIFSGCAPAEEAQIAATTLPVYQFTEALCAGTSISVARLVTESVSCLHDYSLTVRQMKAIERAEIVVISGAGLEEFMEEALLGANSVIDSSQGIALLEGSDHHHHHEEDEAEHDHEHEQDPHIWLSPANARAMAGNICDGLCAAYPEFESVFRTNLEDLNARLWDLQKYSQEQLAGLSCREIITFHDGFGYLADAFGLEILEAIEEESGSEASAQELIGLIELVEHHGMNAIFTEANGSASAASVISAETGVGIYALDMAMSGDDYFASMYHNIDTLKEALK